MLIRNATLERIKSGEVTLAFRRWRRATVKTGGTLKTAIGVLNIQTVEKISLTQITAEDAERAGFPSKRALEDELDKSENQLFKITLSYAGTDPRLELRKISELSADELMDIVNRLQRMDARSQIGSWTLRVLSAINEYPETRAADLAAQYGFDKAWLKANVRKLKNLGLTISHEIGYTLSPRGMTVLHHLRQDE